jgi:Holliday junction resolvasome RuvABC ATP-dependent DNA helicase subunit
MPSRLIDEVSQFVRDVSAELDALSGSALGQYQREVTLEASHLVAAVIDCDQRLTDSELDGYLDAVGPLLDPPLLVSSSQLRQTSLISGRSAWLRQPSQLFELLVHADVRHRTRRTHRYYERALRLAHVAASLDLVPSPAELQGIEAFRTLLLRRLDEAGITRPGQPEPTPSPTPTTPPSTPRSEQPGARPDSAPAAATEGVVAKIDAELPPARTIDDLLAELDGLIGLAHVKSEVRRLTSMLQVQQLRQERGLPVIETSHHLVFSGNPGTGKTTVARLMSQIYRAVGVVSKGHLVETDRSKLVAGFVGQTALKTKETLDASLGGMLLIDEAYSLARGGDNDFGREAIDTLVKFMEDHRDDLAIVAAGYTAEMNDFVDTNPGLKSRFTRTVNFPDYTDDELTEIFLRLCDKNAYHCSDDATDKVRHFIASEPRTRGFGNARFVRNLFEAAIAHQAVRVAPLSDPSTEQLSTLVGADIVAVDS